ncbi:MAG: glycoside hydrolase family 5 protein [Brevinematales bacterium]|nr:glycoside hydrolase family 5 protein [Brevinematales bacterium]
MKKYLAILFISFSTILYAYEGFIKAEGKVLKDSKGKEFFIRGVNLGNWLLPEGYMWQFSSTQIDRPRRIEKLITDLLGEEKAKEFWEKYRDNYIKEKDIELISKYGFNTIRLPINYRLFIEEKSLIIKAKGFLYIDRLLSWCKKYNLFIVIDLHAAPGGQTGANIDDSENDIAELFTNDLYEKMTISLWREIARRYKDEKNILAYDLLNEPLPAKEANYPLYPKLEPLYKKIVKAIREVDKNHIITIEGANWANDWSVFSTPFDPNLLYQFHKYWNKTDFESIKRFVDFREKYNVPIWCGETGENDNEWYRANFSLLERYNIGWAFWPWKKLYAFNCPYSIKFPFGWGKIINYARYGVKPEAKETEEILSNFLENIKIENCEYNEEVLKSIFKAPKSN